jgi:hypothetical protein
MVLSFLMLSGVVYAQSDYPKYCKTSAGVLGPYPNNSVPHCGACYGTAADGKQYNGVAVMSKTDTGCDGDGGGGKKNDDDNSGYPKYCKTSAGVLGPYPNNSVPHCGACYGTAADGKKYNGVAVMSKTDTGCD